MGGYGPSFHTMELSILPFDLCGNYLPASSTADARDFLHDVLNQLSSM
jgi:hypothetical protein